jgi:chemotaxis protein MotB
MMRSIIAVIFCIAILSGCVAGRYLDEAKAKLATCEAELAALKKSSQESSAQIAELKQANEKYSHAVEGLKYDTLIKGSNLRSLTAKYDKLNAVNEQLMDRYNKLLLGAEKDNSRLSGDLQMTTEQLLKRQDELKALGARLSDQQKDLEKLSADLKQREARVAELEEILRKKDQAAADLRKKLSDALIGFENKGLTITQKNGKVYVSMEENLLFASGKTNVEPKGAEALRKVAKVLEQNTDINVMVEGHTDDVPMKGAGEIKDNWDLSVMRATSVTKLMLNSARIDGDRITAAGRGEFFPLDPGKNAEARKKNRRTEIILTPKLDELLKVLGSN